jgi:surface protein
MKKLLILPLFLQLLSAFESQALISGKEINHSIEKKEKQFYKITLPKNKTLRVNLTELEADIDLYIKKGNEARIRFNDCSSSNSKQKNEECILTNDGEDSQYTILVYGFQESTYRLKATIAETIEIPTITNEIIQDSVGYKKSKQYKFLGKKGETYTTTLSHLSADADLRVRVGKRAGLHSFDCKSNNSKTKTDECSVTLKEDATIYVYVYGFRTADYKIGISKSSINAPITLAKLKEMIENNEDVTQVDTSRITDMSNLFKWNKAFNQDIGTWDVSNVTNMSGMFSDSNFNQPIGNWNVSKVTNMSEMFSQNYAFNQPIGSWNVSNVTNMSNMFSNKGKNPFNQPIDSWNVSKVKNMSYMFFNCNFNQDISQWDVSNVTTMSRMLSGYETKFKNHDLSQWNVSKVIEHNEFIRNDSNVIEPKWNK